MSAGQPAWWKRLRTFALMLLLPALAVAAVTMAMPAPAPAEAPNLQAVLDGMNDARAKNGLRPLRRDADLTRMAEVLLRQLADQIRLRPGVVPQPDMDRIWGISRRDYNDLYILHGISGSSWEPQMQEAGKRPGFAEAMQDAEVNYVGIAYASSRDGSFSHYPAHLWIALVGEPTRRAPDGWRRQLIDLVNTFRAEHDLRPVKRNRYLDRAAQAQSNDMLKRDFFDHINPNGEGPMDRVLRTGFRGRLVLENIAGGIPTPETAMTGWINSPGHRKAMLHPDVRRIGLGYAFRSRDWGKVRLNHYWTMVLADPPR